MRARTKQVGVVILAQTACVVVGLWMEHHFEAAAVRQQAREQAWTELEAGVAEILMTGDARAGDLAEPPGGSFQRLLNGLSAAHLPAPTRVLVVDPQWRLVSETATGPAEGRPALPAGRAVAWTPAQDQSAPGGEPFEVVRGTVDLPDGPYVALACALPGGPGQLLFCLSESVVQAHTEMLVETHAPISLMTALWTVVLLAIVVYAVMAHFFERFDRQGTLATKESMRQTQELLRTQDAVIFGLAKLADSRDSDTGEHLERIAAYSTALASELRRYSRYLNEITPAFVKLIGISSALHDIGKVGIEDGILLKPGPLTPEERTRMQDHTIIGGRCLRGIEQHLGSSNFLQMAGKIAFAHHERWDGKGYPYGLAGTEIPLSARIVAVADVYDALATERCYKDVLPHEECVAIIRDYAGTQFDPHLVEVWLGIESRFRDIARQYPAARQARGSREDRLAEPAVEEKHDQHPVPSAAVSN